MGSAHHRFSNQFVECLFCACRHGAEEVEASASGVAASGIRSQAFQGHAYRLGDSEATSEVINAAAAAHPPSHRQVVDFAIEVVAWGQGPLKFLACWKKLLV